MDSLLNVCLLVFGSLAILLAPMALALAETGPGGAGWKLLTFPPPIAFSHGYANACRLERRPGIKDRIEYLSKQQEDLIAEKRQRIEERLWAIHEANIQDLFELAERAKTNKDAACSVGV